MGATEAQRAADELLSVARVSVFVIDDLKAVKRDGIGNSDDIERLAADHGGV